MNDASKLQVGQAHYSAMLYPNGTFVDDVIVHKLGDNDFLIVINAGTREKEPSSGSARLIGHLPSVHINDFSDFYTPARHPGPARAGDPPECSTSTDLGYARRILRPHRRTPRRPHRRRPLRRLAHGTTSSSAARGSLAAVNQLCMNDASQHSPSARPSTPPCSRANLPATAPFVDDVIVQQARPTTTSSSSSTPARREKDIQWVTRWRDHRLPRMPFRPHQRLLRPLYPARHPGPTRAPKHSKNSRIPTFPPSRTTGSPGAKSLVSTTS